MANVPHHPAPGPGASSANPSGTTQEPVIQSGAEEGHGQQQQQQQQQDELERKSKRAKR